MINVKYYHKHTFVFCVANTGDYDFDSACMGLVGTGTSEDIARDSLCFQIKNRIKRLTETMKDVDCVE